MTNVFWLDHERDRMLEQVEARADVARAAGGAAIQSVSPPATDSFPPILSQADYECSDTWMRHPDYPPGWWVGLLALIAFIAIAGGALFGPALVGMVF